MTLLVACAVVYQRISVHKILHKDQITLRFVLTDIAVGGSTVVLLLISLITLSSFYKTQQNIFWKLLADENQTFSWITQLDRGILELITVSVLFSVLFIYYLEHRHPYQLSLLTFMVPQLIVAALKMDVGLEENKLHIEQMLAIRLLDWLSCGIVLVGMTFDLVDVNGQSVDVLKKMALEKEGAQRKLSVQLQTQTSLTQKVHNDMLVSRVYVLCRRMSLDRRCLKRNTTLWYVLVLVVFKS